MDKYYFYTGFNKPKQIDLATLTLDDNYLGDITDDFIAEHEEYKGQSDSSYNDVIGLVYGVFRNPDIIALQKINKRYGLSKSDYLSDFMN